MRSRTKSDFPGSRASAGRYTFEELHTVVLLVGFDHERQCPNSCPICWRIQPSRGMASDAQQICSRHSESTVRFHAEDHDASETLVWPTLKVLNQAWEPGSWMSENGNVRQELLWQTRSNTQWRWIWYRFFEEQLAVGYIRQECRRSALLQWCYSSRNFGANPTVSAGSGAGADDDNRMQVDSLKRGKVKGIGKHQHQKGNRTNNTSNTSNTDVNTCNNCGRTGHWAKDCWRPGGGAYDNPTSNNSHTQKSNNYKKGKGKG